MQTTKKLAQAKLKRSLKAQPLPPGNYTAGVKSAKVHTDKRTGAKTLRMKMKVAAEPSFQPRMAPKTTGDVVAEIVLSDTDAEKRFHKILAQVSENNFKTGNLLDEACTLAYHVTKNHYSDACLAIAAVANRFCLMQEQNHNTLKALGIHPAQPGNDEPKPPSMGRFDYNPRRY